MAEVVEINDEIVTCQICGKQFANITFSHLKLHGISVAEYRTQYPDTELLSIQSRRKVSKALAGIVRGPLSAEHKEKIRVAHIGMKLSAEHIQKIRVALTGKPGWSKGLPSWNKGLKGVMKPNATSFKKGNIPWTTGKKVPCSEQRRKKMCGILAGEKKPAWVQGRARRKYSFEFSDELKELIRKRDGNKCQQCGKPQAESKRKLPVHHIDYNKDNLDPSNLITLCFSCHGKTMHKREYWTELLRLCVNA